MNCCIDLDQKRFVALIFYYIYFVGSWKDENIVVCRPVLVMFQVSITRHPRGQRCTEQPEKIEHNLVLGLGPIDNQTSMPDFL